jgi:hypothetical protein
MRTNAAAPPSPTVDRVLHTPWGAHPWRRQPPPGEMVRARSLAPFWGGRGLKVEMVEEISSHTAVKQWLLSHRE